MKLERQRHPADSRAPWPALTPDQPPNINEFAPRASPTDGRAPWEWKSKWGTDAWVQISFETAYVISLFVIVLAGLFLVWLGQFQALLKVPRAEYGSFDTYTYAVLGGLLGGTLFDLKWLYHSVARGKWHRDRILWRLFTPLISAGLALVVVGLGAGGLLPLIDVAEFRRAPATLGVAFLVGYFSDRAVAAMSTMADRVLGQPISSPTIDPTAPNRETDPTDQ